jgi:cell division protein FtsL
MSSKNSKDYRNTVLTYIEKLGEIDKLEDELRERKKEVSELKKEIDDCKRKKINE